MNNKKLENSLHDLNEVGKKLKNDFVGLDEQIDKILDNIKVWYCMPNLLTSPVIINLWGMTGTGKTDLVRKLSRYLGFSSKLLEIQMDSDIDSGWQKLNTLKKALQYSDINEGERGIVLLDEFQRFNSKDQLGGVVKHERYNDVWMLLSDGKFNIGASRMESEIDEYITEENCRIESYKKQKQEPNGGLQNNYLETKIGLYRAKYLKTLLRLKNPIQDLCNLTPPDVIKICEENYKNANTYSNFDYSKCLIFICGNLDGAYSMAKDVADADLDADILHKYSKQINLVDIKKTLFNLFKPEQVARLGSNHVIYPCLNSKNYRKIIKRSLDKFKSDCRKNMRLSFTYSSDVVKVLYANFVFPSQGVRPVFSGINSFLSKVLPPLFFDSINHYNGKPVNLVAEKGDIYAKIGDDLKKVEYDFDLDKIKKRIPKEKRAIFSVHEAGHALIYAMLFKYAPKQINTEITNFDGAYVIPNIIFSSKESSINLMKVFLAGIAAEEIVFGDLQRSTGCAHDITMATSQASKMVRSYGMDGLIGNYQPEYTQNVAEYGITDFDKTNAKIENIINNAYKDTKLLLNNNRGLLKKLSEKLLEIKKMSGKEFHSFMKKDIEGLTYSEPLNIDANEEIIGDYFSQFEKFKTEV